MKELSIEDLTDEAIKLLRMGIDDLYATLGCQLLAQNNPTRVGGIVSYLSAIRSASEARDFYETLSSGPTLSEWGSGLWVIYQQLKQDGMSFISEVTEDLRKALCNEEVIRLSGQINRSTVQVVVMIVGASLKMPREFDPISVTVSAILFKLGLRNFCQKT